MIKYGKRPLLNPAGKIYFIGDIHSEGEKLVNLLAKLEPLIQPGDHIVFLGDLFDRGPTTSLVVEALVAFNRKFPDQVFFVEGNHDWMLKHYLITGRHDWMQYLAGTITELQSTWNLPDYKPETIAQALIDKGFDEISSKFIPYYETPKVIGTHAPLDPTRVYLSAGRNCEGYIYEYNDHITNGIVPFEYLLERLNSEIMWQFTDERLKIRGVDKFLVCGHQPPPGKLKHPRIYKHRAFIDTGCGKGDRPVTCLIYPSKKYIQSDR